MTSYELEEVREAARQEVRRKLSVALWIFITVLFTVIFLYGDFLVTNGYANPNGDVASAQIYRIEVATSTPTVQPTLTPFPTVTVVTTIEEPAKGVKDPTNLAPTPSSPSPSTLQQGLGKPGKP
jgi:hypothetical protein